VEGQGLLGFLLNKDEWITTLLRAEHSAPAAFQPLVHPGDKPNTAAAFPPWKLDLDRYLEQRQDNNKFKMLLRASLDEVSLMAMDTDEDGASAISLGQMLTILDGMYRVLSPADLSRNSDKLTVPFQAGSAIRLFITNQRRVHLVASSNGFPLPETEKVRAFVTALLPCGQFNARIDAWKMAFPTAIAQTFDLLSLAIIEYADNNDMIATNGTHLYANSVEHHPAINSLFSDIQMSKFAQLVAAAVQVKPNKINTNKPGQQHYCWTHGFGGHSSNKCLHPDEGHVESAHGKNQQGGSTKTRRSF
jgi:hypothetical protein